MKNNLVVKKNPLINARYKMTPLELKIVLSVIGLIQKEDSNFWTYQLPVRDIASDYKDIQRASRSLLSKVFEIETPGGWLMLSWFSSIEYKKKSGLIECSFDPKMTPYLLEIKDNFTSYTLKSVLPMRSTYSIRLYELLKQYEKIGTRRFALDDLQNTLQVPTSYRIWRAFKRRVLDIALKEINEHSDIMIGHSFDKESRKVSSVSFSIRPNPKNLPLKQYIAFVRTACVNKLLYEAVDENTKEVILLSVSNKGYLYNQNNPNWKCSHTRALEIWARLQKSGVCLE